MSQAAPAITRSPAEVVRQTPVSQAANGICYAVAGETAMNSFDLERMIAAVPGSAAAASAESLLLCSAHGQPGRRNHYRRPLQRRPQRQCGLPSQSESRRFESVFISIRLMDEGFGGI